MPQPLYFECHITLTPMTAEQLTALRKLVSRNGFTWRVANFALLSDTPNATPKMFLSCRSLEYRQIHSWAEEMWAQLVAGNFPVTRIKIESCIFDLHLP